MTYNDDCTVSVSRSHSLDNRGICDWCGRKAGPAVPAPNLGIGHISTELGDAYRYFFDPDWGSEQIDY